jgi:hypothetical protein
MLSDSDLFNLSPNVTAQFTMAGPSIPVLQVDDVYASPDAVREKALALPFSRPAYPYPGKIAAPPATKSLLALSEWVLRVANEHYLRHIPPVARDGQRITAFRQVFTDFAIVDVHPDELSPTQRLPHVDPVPVFGLIYLNREERGGTLFFEKVTDAAANSSGGGYVTGSNGEFHLRGRIEAAFNRLVIYPGFVPHSAQIAGDWIEGEERFTSPRLTQRFVFFP